MDIKTRLWLSGLCAVAVLFAACDEDSAITELVPEETLEPDEETVSVPGEIIAFSIDGNDGIIDNDVITVVVPQNADLTELAPEITLDTEGANVVPASGEPQDFTDSVTEPLEYTVSAHKTYAVTVKNAGHGSSERAITGFTITVDSKPYTGTIDEAQKTITLVLPYGTSLVSLAPKITLSTNATVTPASDSRQNFSFSNVVPFPYTVTAQNGMQARYNVTVIMDGQGSVTPPLGMTLTLSPDNLRLPSYTPNASVSANTGFDSYSWTIDGAPAQAYGRLITIIRANHIIGPHILSVTAYKDGVPFNAEMTFTIEP
jgi:hypothetical protein